MRLAIALRPLRQCSARLCNRLHTVMQSVAGRELRVHPGKESEYEGCSASACARSCSGSALRRCRSIAQVTTADIVGRVTDTSGARPARRHGHGRERRHARHARRRPPVRPVTTCSTCCRSAATRSHRAAGLRRQIDEGHAGGRRPRPLRREAAGRPVRRDDHRDRRRRRCSRPTPRR